MAQKSVHSAREGSVGLLDLPREVRDMIYGYFPYLASIHVNQDPAVVHQPNISKVNRQLREESLDKFYGQNKFFLDLRGWKHTSFPHHWTPTMIFEHWITAIGNKNAARIRSLSFFSFNFRVNVKISSEKPPTLTLRFRTSSVKAELAEGVSSSYNFDIAASRAEEGLKGRVETIQNNSAEAGLGVDSILSICQAVETVQPFLCKRMSLGYQGLVLKNDSTPLEMWPDTAMHLDKCDDCGHHRFTKNPHSND